MVIGSRSRKYNRERMEAVEVTLMIKTALLVAYSALARQESRGSHYRTDFPLSDDKGWLKNIVLTKNRNDKVEISVKEIV